MEVSSPDKVMFPTVGATKADMVAYYELVGAAMLPFLTGRPLTLQRFPGGVAGKGFMQKNAGNHFPPSIHRLAVPKRDGDETIYPVVDQVGDIPYLANQNTVTFHMWTSSADRPGNPDWMVIDLDPEAGDLNGVRAAGHIVGELLAEFGLAGFLLATGSKGFHVWVRLDGIEGFEGVSSVSRALAGLAVRRSPDLLTTEFLKKNRRGRVFVDWLRNAPTATVVVPFSLRPRSGAPAAVPIRWDELDVAAPDDWGLGRLDDRLQIEIGRDPQPLPVERIVDAARDAGVDLDTPHDRFGRRG